MRHNEGGGSDNWGCQSMATASPSPFLASSWQVSFGGTVQGLAFASPLEGLWIMDHVTCFIVSFYTSELSESTLSPQNDFEAQSGCGSVAAVQKLWSEPCSAPGLRHISHTACMKFSYLNRRVLSAADARIIANNVSVFARMPLW